MSSEFGADIRILFPEAGLTAIFDECDQFEQDETGGRLVGTYTQHGGKLTIHVTGIIESGPQAKRSAVSFFQDGEYQEGVFRQIESRSPEIEHLGNWHTHHVNGLAHLSGGDISTYQRTVNHHKHNVPFFYAVLVTAKHRTSEPRRRYSIKHYIFLRGEADLYEIPARNVEIVDSPLVWPSTQPIAKSRAHASSLDTGARPDRVNDREIIDEFYKGFQPFSSPKLGVYWRGGLELVNGRKIQVVVLEDATTRTIKYSVTLREPPAELQAVADELAETDFPSARAALIVTERSCNRALYRRANEQAQASL